MSTHQDLLAFEAPPQSVEEFSRKLEYTVRRFIEIGDPDVLSIIIFGIYARIEMGHFDTVPVADGANVREVLTLELARVTELCIPSPQPNAAP